MKKDLLLETIKEDFVFFIAFMALFAMEIALGARLALYICVWGGSMMYTIILGMVIYITNAFTLRGILNSIKETYYLEKELERVRR